MKRDTFLDLLPRIETMNELDETIVLLGCVVGGQPITICIDTDAYGNQYWSAKYVYNFDEEAPNDLRKKR